MKSTIRYLNTDLELVSAVDLAPLADALASKGLFQLHLSQHGTFWHASFETGEPFDSPEPNIAAFLSAIESLDTVFRDQWSACASRIFDIGFECGDEPFGFGSYVTPSTLARVVAAGASLHLTLYPSSSIQPSHHDAETHVA